LGGVSDGSHEHALPVTAVIPAYRRPDMVERAIRSVLAQGRPPAEVIVVDDASGDDTGAQAASLGARVITHDRNMGEGEARNTGLRAASHEWVALLDSDDEWLPDHLETLWAERNGHLLVGSAVLVTGAPEDHRVYGWTGRSPRVLTSPAEVAAPENKLSPSSVVLRREPALEAGGFRNLRRAADMDMWVRLLERGTALAIPRVTALYHLHPGQVSQERREMHAAHRAVLEAHTDRSWCTMALRRRHEGVVAWDEVRAQIADGGPTPEAILLVGRKLANPQRAIGLLQLLVGRWRGRRRAARIVPGGVPSVAIMPGVDVEPAGVPGAVDLRRRSLPAALFHLLRAPAARALVRGTADALAVRALGVTPVKPPR
jgi:hypothetical protein